MNTRLTRREIDAILTALGQVLAGPLDGFWDEDAEAEVVKAMKSAQQKLWDRQERAAR